MAVARICLILIGDRKNRRDAATVSSRVLAISDFVGRKLFDNAVRSSEAADAVDVSTRKMRRKDISTSSRL